MPTVTISNGSGFTAEDYKPAITNAELKKIIETAIANGPYNRNVTVTVS